MTNQLTKLLHVSKWSTAFLSTNTKCVPISYILSFPPQLLYLLSIAFFPLLHNQFSIFPHISCWSSQTRFHCQGLVTKEPSMENEYIHISFYSPWKMPLWPLIKNKVISGLNKYSTIFILNLQHMQKYSTVSGLCSCILAIELPLVKAIYQSNVFREAHWCK